VQKGEWSVGRVALRRALWEALLKMYSLLETACGQSCAKLFQLKLMNAHLQSPTPQAGGGALIKLSTVNRTKITENHELKPGLETNRTHWSSVPSDT
jgi:hypothetical protein